MILTDSRIEAMADKICELMINSTEEYNKKHEECIEPCDICPFTSYCSIGKTGFTEFFKQETNK